MSISNEQLLEDLCSMDDNTIQNQLDILLSAGVSNYDDDPNTFFDDLFNSPPVSSNTDAQTPAGYSPGAPSNSNTSDESQEATRLEIIAEPYYGKRLRYRSDYEKNENRKGYLTNRSTRSSYQGPAIKIPQCYLMPAEQYYIRVCLVTIKNGTNDLHHFHPYELENPIDIQWNDQQNNAVWFPIKGEELSTGVKSFPSLRIVKKKASDLKGCDPLRVFDFHGQISNERSQNSSPSQIPRGKTIIEKYSLESSQLAFTVAKKMSIDGPLSMKLDHNTTVFSEKMVEESNGESTIDNDTESPTNSSQVSTSKCRVFKYAPRYGFAENNEDMLVVLTCKLEPKKYGDLKVIFQYTTLNDSWSAEATELVIKDRIVSFKTPIFSRKSSAIIPVDVFLRQTSREVGQLKYFYLATLELCSTCQFNTLINSSNVIPNVPRKRHMSNILAGGDEDDAFVPVNEPRQSVSQTEASALMTESNFVPVPPMDLTPVNRDPSQQVMNKIADAVESLFADDNYTLLLKICRKFINVQPQLLHHALSKNASILMKFIPIATKDILQHRNERGETIFLHAIRLNRVDIVKTLMKSKYFSEIFKDVDNEKNNSFHVLASNENSSELLDHLLDKSTSIQENFDQMNKKHRTPLQLSICHNNLPATQRFLKYFQSQIYETHNHTGDNLIHLAVRHADLTMVKYLIEEGQLIQQGNQSNLRMTPMELARSLKRSDLIEYLEEKYRVQEETDEDTSSDETIITINLAELKLEK